MGNYIISYDLGTGGVKAAIYDEEGLCKAKCFTAYKTFYSGKRIHEQRPTDWWDAVIKSTKNLFGLSKICKNEIICLSISGHSLGVVPLDGNGDLLLKKVPIWSDTRATKQTEIFFKKIKYNNWYKTTGNGFSKECYPVFKIQWYKENYPDIFNKIDKILGTKDYINFMLTGKIYTDYSYASGTGIYDLLGWKYSDNLIEISELPEYFFPDIVPSAEVIGYISKEASTLLGLHDKVKVVCGGVDNSCMALGAGNIREGRAYTSLGSSAWVAVSSEKPIIDYEIKPFTFTHVIPKMFTSSFGVFSAGSSLKWVRDNFCRSINPGNFNEVISYEAMDTLAGKSNAGANKLIFNPSLAGGSMAHLNTNIRGGFIGLDLSHELKDIIRATMEGVVMDLRMFLEKLNNMCPISRKMVIVGGGTKSKLWNQIFADIYNMPIVRLDIGQDAAALGAAALGAVGLGMWCDYSIIDNKLKESNTYNPNVSHIKKYNKIFRIYKEVYMRLSELGDMLEQE